MLQIRISNTHSNQGAVYHTDSIFQVIHCCVRHLTFQSSLSESPSWTLRIEGKLTATTPAVSLSSPPSATAAPATIKFKFSSFFSKLFIQLDKGLYPGQDIIEWHNTATNDGFDGFEVKRPGSVDTNAKILFYLDHKPPIFKLSPKLAATLNVAAETKSRIITLLWQYVRVRFHIDAISCSQHNKLQDPDDRKTIINNAQLKEVRTSFC